MQQETMKALVIKEVGKIALEDVPVPQIVEPTDAIVRVTLSTICASDVHIVEGGIYTRPPFILGHEFCGEVVEVGPAVKKVKPGDRAAVSAGSFCGTCFNCRHGEISRCTSKFGGCFGTSRRLQGCQAEYIKVPYADSLLFSYPDTLTEEDVLFVGDMLSTGYYGASRADIMPGDTVLIVGVGPVGMSAAACARLYGPSKIIVVDRNPFRLNVCLKEGIADYAINAAEEDVVARVKEMTDGWGVDRAIEAIGMESTVMTCMESVRIGGTVSSIGAYTDSITLPMRDIWFNNITFRTGMTSNNCGQALIKLIEEGKLNSKFLITHKAPLNDIIKGYDYFGHQKDNCIKWLITPYEG